MCETFGFVPKSAIGKNVRCVSEKCMMPVFKATESGEKTAERKPTRLSDDSKSARKVASTSQPTKRNPVVIYAIVGGVLLALTAGLLIVLNKRPDESSLKTPVNIPHDQDLETLEEKELRLATEAEEVIKAAADVPSPMAEVKALAKQMIVLARQPNLRDKAWARRMTADLYLQTNEATLAAQELKQLIAVDRSKSFYRIEPHVTQYWQRMAAGKKDAAKESLNLALAERDAIPKTSRAGTEAALSLASVLAAEGKMAEAQALVESRRVDTSITANRDMMASVAWFWIADHSRENVTPVPSATDIMVWSEPLHTTVACDLALHQRWTEAISWSLASKNPSAVSASLTEIATIAGATKAPSSVMQQITAAIPEGRPVLAVHVLAAVAAASQDKTALEAAIAAIEKLSAPVPVTLPTTQQIAEKYSSEREEELMRAVAVADVVRAAVLCGETEKAQALMIRLRTELNAAAPPTREIRVLALEVSLNESAARKRIANDLKTTNSSQIDKTFKEYRRHLISEGNQSGLYVITEDRRLRAIQLLSRIIRAGGATIVQTALNDPATGWADEIMLDDLTGLMAASTLQSKQTLPEIMQPNPALAMNRIEAGHAALVARIAPVLATAWATRDKQLGEGLKALENGCGNELPGLRQAYVNELVASMARSAKDPDYVLTAIGALPNSVWREEAYLIAGRNFVNRNLEAPVRKWLDAQRLPALEQICLMYGMALVLADRAAVAAENVPVKK